MDDGCLTSGCTHLRSSYFHCSAVLPSNRRCWHAHNNSAVCVDNLHRIDQRVHSLYDRNQRWPREFVILQLVFVVLTALRITRLDPGEDGKLEEGESEYEYDNSVEELLMFSYWMQTDLHRLFYTEQGIDKLRGILVTPIFLVFVVWLLATILTPHYDSSLRRLDDTTLSTPIVFLRNLFLLSLVEICMCLLILSPGSGSYIHCQKAYNVTPGLIAPNYTIAEITSDQAAAWKVFHPSNLAWIILSHSVLYPSILLLLTRRRLAVFAVWVFFLYTSPWEFTADMFHYVSGPELAEERLEFQESITECYANVMFLKTMLGYSLNFLFLTTPMGDIAASTSAVLHA